MAEQNPPKVKRTPVDFDPFAKGQDKKIKRTPVDFDPFAGSPPQTPPTDPFAQAPPQEQEGLTQGPSGSVDAYGDGLYQTSAAASPSALAAGSSASSSRPSVTEPLPPFGQQPPAPEQVAPPERNTAMETAMSTGDWKSSQALEAAQPKGLLDEEQRKNLQAEWDKLMVPGPKDTWQPPQRAKDIQKALETDKKVREIPAKLVNSALAAKDSPVFAQREDEVGPAQQYDWQNVDDPRRRQLEKEAVDYAQQDQTIFRYDPRKRQSMIDQGGWDNAKEASYQSSIISHAQEVVAGKQILLQRGIDSGAIDPQQAEQMKADIQSRANYVKAGWEAVQKLDPKTIQEKLNEQNQQVADIQHSMGLTGAGTATAQKIGEGAVSGVGNTMIKPLLMAYSKVFGDDSTYSTADRAIDAIAEVTSEMDSHVASHYRKQLFEKNEDGTTDFNPQSIVPQLAGGITELVPFLALSEAGAAAGASEGALFGNAALGASIGSKAAIFGTTYADTYDRYIRDTMAKDKNITEAEAKEGANIAATGTALLFAVNPNLDMAATQKKVGAKVFSQMADGVTKKDIVANLLKEIGKGGTTQAGLNFGVLAADNVANDAVNQLAGTNLPTEQTAHELLSSTAGAFLIGGALALGHGGSVSDMRAKAMRSAMEHPEAAKQVVKESSIPSEQKAQAYNNIDNARRDYVGNNLKRTGITDAKATQFVDNEAQIRQIKEHIKENPPSDVVKEAKSDPRDAQLEKLYKEQRDILGIPEPEAKPSEAKKEPVALPKAKEEQPTEKKSDGNRSDRNGSVKKRADGAPEGGGKQPSAELPNNNRMGSGNPGNEASASAGAGQVPERGPGDAQGSQRGTKADQRVNAGDVVLPGRVLRGVDGDNAGGVSGTTEEVGAKDIYTQAPTAESPTTGVQVAEGKKRNAVVDAALEIAPKNDGATKSEAPTPDKVQGESVEPTATTGDGEAVRAADVAKPTSEVERLSDDALLGGQAEKNRKAGKREIAGQEYKRQAPQDAPEGKEGKVQFSEGVDVPFQYALMDADAIQPSHAAGRRNPLHFIPEAQPKPRTDAESQLAASRIAQAPDIDKVGSSPNAYSGAPIVNARGEVVQGNNRATGLKEHYKQGGTSYKQDLAKNADQYGLTAEQVDGMKNPILVRRIHTSDVKSIELGNYDAKDIESGGKGSIDPVAVSARIPTSAKASIAERLFGNSGDATLKSAIRESYSDLTKMLEPYLNPAQRNTLYSKGTNEPSARGMQELESLVKHFLFDGGAPELSEVFESLPHHAQAGITAAMPQILSSPESQAITKEVQNAVMSASAFRVSGVESFGAWAAQADAFGPSATEVYTPTEMAMAKLMAEAKTTKAVREKLNQYAGSTKPSEATMFDGASEGKSLQQAAEDVFGITSPKQNDQSADKSSGAKAPAGAVQAAEGSGVDAAKAGEGSNTRNAKDGSGELVQEQRGEAPQVPLTGVAHIDSVTKALSNLVPDLKVTIHESAKDFNATLNGRGDPNSAAFYDRDAGEIHINLSRAKDNTLFHEAAHVVLAAAVDNNPVMLHELFKQLEGTPEFDKYKKFGALYGDKPISTQMEEAVAEYMADIGSGKARTSALPKSLYQKLKQWIKDMLAKLGFGPKDIKLDPANLRKFAEDFAKAMTEGIKVRGEKVKQGERTSLQHDADRLVDGWYSRLDDAVANKGNTQSGADWGKWMDARAKDGSLSAEEVKWTGLGDWLAGKGKEKVTPKEVRDFLKDNRVKVEVKELTNNYTESSDETDAMGEYSGGDGDAKFSQYQLPGGENYREVLVTLPSPKGPSGWELVVNQEETDYQDDGENHYNVVDSKGRTRFTGPMAEAKQYLAEEAGSDRAGEDKVAPPFNSSHFDEPNILVHLRVNDRTDADGKKVLFIEELQSDWGQKGKKEGFGGRPSWIVANALGQQQAYFDMKEQAEYYLERQPRGGWDTTGWTVEQRDQPAITPSAPFVTSTGSWVELGIKQAIRMAVDGGYDKIAWANGAQQVNHYRESLQKNVDRIEWTKTDNGIQLLGSKNGVKTVDTTEKENALSDAIGKSMGDKIINDPGQSGVIEGDDITISDTGMAGFYDKILPNAAKKVGKKLGGDGKVGEAAIDTDRKRWEISPPSTTVSGKWMVKNALDPTSKGLHFDTEAEAQIALKGKVRSTQQQSITITPEMKAKVGMGVPLMQLNPEKVAAAMRAEGFDAKAAKDYLEGENVSDEDKKAIIAIMDGPKEPQVETPPVPPRLKGKIEKFTPDQVAKELHDHGFSPNLAKHLLSNNKVDPKFIKAVTDKIEERGPVPIPRPEATAKESAAKFQEVMDKQRKDAKAAITPRTKRIRNAWIKGFEDPTGLATSALRKQGGSEVADFRNLAFGAGGTAKAIFEKAREEVHHGLDTKEKDKLDDMIEGRRIINIDKRYDGILQDRLKHPGGLNKEIVESALAEMKAKDPEEFDKLSKRADAYFETMRNIFGDLTEAGLVSKELHDELSGDEYSPRTFIHHMVEQETALNVGRKDGTQEALKGLAGGSEESLFHRSDWLMATYISSAYKRIAMNKANQELLSFAKEKPDNGIATVVEPNKDGSFPEPAKGTVRIGAYVDGKLEAMDMERTLGESWQGSDPLINHTAGNIIRVVSGGSLFRLFTTGINPAFALTNPARDIGHVMLFTNNYSPVLPVAMAQMARDLGTVVKDAITRGPRWQNAVREGVSMDFLSNQGNPFEGAGLAAKGRVRDRVERGYEKAFAALNYINETSEIFTRLAVRERATNNGIKEFKEKNGRDPNAKEIKRIQELATAKAREYMDFGQGGKASKAIDTAVPYINAQFQGLRVMSRYTKNNPKVFAFKMTQYVAIAAMAAAWNFGLFGDDEEKKKKRAEEWDKVPDYVKENNVVVMTNLQKTNSDGTIGQYYIKFPKTQDARIYATFIEGMMEWAMRGKEPTKRSVQSFEQNSPFSMQNLANVPLITAYNAYLNGYDNFRDDYVVDPKANVEPWMQRRPDTPAFFKDLGEGAATIDDKGNKVGGISPEKARLAVEKYAGLSKSNPFSIVLDGAYDQTKSLLSPEERAKSDKAMVKQLEALGGSFSHRYLGVTSDRSDREALDRYNRADETRRMVVSEMVKLRLAEYREAKDPKSRSEVTKQAEAEFKKNMTKAEFKRAAKAYALGQKHSDVPYFYISLYYANNNDIKAKALFDKWQSSPKEEHNAILNNARKVGVLTDDVREKFKKLMLESKTEDAVNRTKAKE